MSMTNSATDFLNLDELLNEEQKMVQQTASQFVKRSVMPKVNEAFVKEELPRAWIEESASLGLLGPTIKGYGCPGLDAISYGLIMLELERGDSGLRSFASVQGALAMHPIYQFGSEEQKQKFLPDMQKGKLIGCFGLTEPDFGSNPGGMQTRARKEGSYYILNGNKMWITNGCIADLAIVWAKLDEPGSPHHDKVFGFIIEKDFAGFTTKTIKNKWSLKASVTSELILENVRVPEENRLHVMGLKGPFACLNQARYGIAWGAMGAAEACLFEALNYAKTRIQFDQPIAGFQLVQSKLTKMFTEIQLGKLLAFRLGQLKNTGGETPQQISLAKMNNVAKALDIARLSRDILGASGITHEYHVGRHLLNLESVNTYEGTADIHALVLGEMLTGIPAYR